VSKPAATARRGAMGQVSLPEFGMINVERRHVGPRRTRRATDHASVVGTRLTWARAYFAIATPLDWGRGVSGSSPRGNHAFCDRRVPHHRRTTRSSLPATSAGTPRDHCSHCCTEPEQH
jgi:hypothetical protein